jgi:hypothetical protein
MESSDMKKSSRSSSKVTFVSERPEKNVKPVFIFVIFVVMLLSAAYLYIKNGMDEQKVQTTATSTQMVNQQPENVQPQTLLDKLKKHLLVTETDIPYIATITNVSLVKEKNPDFYANASDGDKVIVWKDRAVIYSESQDRIVAVATAKPLLATGASGQGMTSSTASVVSETDAEAITRQIASTTIEIRNGSRKNGAARTLKARLEAVGLNIAKVGDTGIVYQGTQVVDLTQGNAPAALDLILKTASGTAVTTIPEGEKPTTAQVLVIIGK